MKRLMADVALVAPTEGRVLLTGENGSGKEEVARLIHVQSSRKDAPFVEVNCAAIPEELIESELFGHQKGAFTGAVRDQKGKFREADGGTLFLDEVGDMSLKTQAKVLRALQEGRVEPVGGGGTVGVDVRVIAATNKDLAGEITRGRFREDLYFRLAVVPLRVPPLRERPEDILPLAEAFITRIAHQYGRPPRHLGPEAKDTLLRHDWPGNVRELKNAIERMAAMHSEHHPETALPSALVNQSRSADLERLSAAVAVEDAPTCEFVVRPKSPVFTISESERNAIERALAAAHGERGKTARLLGMGRTTLYRKMKEYGLD
jgi:two-component system nitrogen regulation response regulator NtrX